MTRLPGIILAAGSGRRLGRGPKCLVQVRGEAIIDGLVRAASAAELDPLIVVTGDSAELVERRFAELWPGEFVPAFNASHASLGNAASLSVGLTVAFGRTGASRCVVMNSDIVIEPDVVSEVRQVDRDLVLACEPKSEFDGEEMCVSLNPEGRVVALAKGLADPWGEYIGVSAVSAAFARAYQAFGPQAYSTRYYEDVYSELCGSFDVGIVPVEAGSWFEIDTQEDLDRANASGVGSA